MLLLHGRTLHPLFNVLVWVLLWSKVSIVVCLKHSMIQMHSGEIALQKESRKQGHLVCGRGHKRCFISKYVSVYAWVSERLKRQQLAVERWEDQGLWVIQRQLLWVSYLSAAETCPPTAFCGATLWEDKAAHTASGLYQILLPCGENRGRNLSILRQMGVCSKWECAFLSMRHWPDPTVIRELP